MLCRRFGVSSFSVFGWSVMAVVLEVMVSMAEVPRNAAVLSSLQTLMLTTVNVTEFLTELTGIATQVVSSVPLSCGITMRFGVSAFTVAASDDQASRLDETQYETGDGPCLAAMRSGQVMHCVDVETEQRWPPYTVRARQLGLGCSLSVPLVDVDQTTFGAMNVYGFGQPGLFDADRQYQFGLFASQATGALRLATRHANDTALMVQLEQALNSRTVIDQAVGILIGRHQVSAARAFDLLRAQSQSRKKKMRDVAAELVAEATGEPPTPGRPFST